MHIRPAAPKNMLLGWNAAGELRVKVAAPALEGRANKALVSFLAKRFSVARRDLTIESGELSRVKIVSGPDSILPALEKIPEE